MFTLDFYSFAYHVFDETDRPNNNMTGMITQYSSELIDLERHKINANLSNKHHYCIGNYTN